MLTISLPEIEFYDEKNEKFFTCEKETLLLEHSLVSISKWESIFHKPFFKEEPRTVYEIVSYVECMMVENKDIPYLHSRITDDIYDKVSSYIDNDMTATTFSSVHSKPSKEIVTSEIIYYWMTALNIPFECQYWHFNRLMTLIKVCSIKSSPSKKMGKREQALMNSRLNQMRRKKLNTKG